MLIPTNLKYTKTDEWILIEGNKVTLGITDYAQEQLSDVVYVEIRVDEGETVNKDSIAVTLESVKAAADVNLPVSGKVLTVNSGLSGSPELVNSDPYGKAWMIKIELSKPAELNDLLDPKAYEAHCQEREH